MNFIIKSNESSKEKLPRASAIQSIPIFSASQAAPFRIKSNGIITIPLNAFIIPATTPSNTLSKVPLVSSSPLSLKPSMNPVIKSNRANSGAKTFSTVCLSIVKTPRNIPPKPLKVFSNPPLPFIACVPDLVNGITSFPICVNTPPKESSSLINPLNGAVTNRIALAKLSFGNLNCPVVFVKFFPILVKYVLIPVKKFFID